MPDTVAEQHKLREALRRHFVGVVAGLTVLFVLSAIGLGVVYGQAASYRSCTAGYIKQVGTAQAPVRKASAAANADLHGLLRATKIHGGDSPAAVHWLDMYLADYHGYTAALRNHPLPTLPWCLT